MLAVEDHLKCIDHIGQHELWKAKALAIVLEIGGIRTLDEITEDGRMKILNVMKRRGKIPLTENVYMNCVKDDIHISAGAGNTFRFCLRKGMRLRIFKC